MVWFFLIFFYVLVLVIGLYAGKVRQKDPSIDQWLLADRQLGMGIGIFTMAATWVGGGYINGTAEAVSTSGFVWAQAPWGYALSLLLGGIFFVKPMRKAGFRTLIDPFSVRYGPKTAAVLFVPALIGELFWSAAILAALGATAAVILDIDLVLAIVLSAGISLFYTWFGGLWSVAYTDVAQLLMIILGLGISVPFIVQNTGGFDAMVERFHYHFGDVSFLPPLSDWHVTGSESGAGWQWLDFALLLSLGGIPWQVYFQRVLACKTDRTARALSVGAGVFCIVLAVPAAIIGMASVGIDWAATGISVHPDPSMILSAMLESFTPPIVAALGLGAVAAAVMSSVDSSVISASSMWILNVYRPLVRPDASEKTIRSRLQWSVPVIGLLATILAVQVQSVYALWYLCADLVYVLLFPQLILALFDKKTVAWAVLAGIVVGLFLRVGGGEPVFGIGTFLPYPMQNAAGEVLFPFRTFAMICCGATTFFLSRIPLLTQEKTENLQPES